jgi:hypothetical protein
LAYNSYSTFRRYNSSSPELYFKDGLQKKIDQDFSSSINFRTIKIKDRFTGLYSDINVRLESYGLANSIHSSDEYKRLVFQDMDFILYLGDIFEFDGYRWIATQVKGLNTATRSCIVQRCNCILKFTESTPLTSSIIEIDCFAYSSISNTSNENVIDLPVGSLFLQLPLDANALKIRLTPKPTRFLLGLKDYKGEYKAWEVENIDTITNTRLNVYGSTPLPYIGILNIILKESLIDKVKDDHTVGVAYQRYF